MEGTLLAHYKIVRKIGQGGMGVVYLAEDTKLGRMVALKLLAQELLTTPESVERFRIEARAAAALNHPNIATLYSVEEADGRLFLTMEYVEGQPMSAQVSPQGLEVNQFAQLFIPLADAFAHAHDKGIVHRDIKPENILITKEKTPKILDFGLARIARPAPGPQAASLPTASMHLTLKGTVMGTVAYMSPEQAEARPVDSRSDIFSLGVVMYELLAGRRPFHGDTPISVITNIIKEEPPPLASLRPHLPRDITRIIRRSMQKDLLQRFQSMRDLRNDLEEARAELGSGAVAGTPVGAGRQRRWGLLAGVALAAALTAGGLVYLRSRESPGAGPALAELVRLTTLPGLEDEPSWSPDGRSVVYSADEGGRLGIWMRQIAGERAIRLGNPDVDEAQPAWSPDGGQIAFVSTRDRGGSIGLIGGVGDIALYLPGQNGDLFVRPALGGAARRVAEHAYDPSWSPDGKSLAFRSIRDGSWRIWTATVEEGRAAPVRGVEPPAHGPAWSPDGRFLAYFGAVRFTSGWDLYVVPAAGGAPVKLSDPPSPVALRPSWSPDGRSIIFSSNRGGSLNLWRVPFRADPPGAASPLERVTTGIGEDVNPIFSPDGSSLAYASVHTAPDIWRIDEASAQLSRLTAETSSENHPRLSPDGRKLSFSSNRSGRLEVWTMDLQTKEITQLSRGGGTFSAWSPNGQTLAYATPQGLRLLDLKSSQVRTVAADLSIEYPTFSPDGRTVSFEGQKDQLARLYRVPAAGGEATAIATPEGLPGNPSWSLEGKTIFYHLGRADERNVWAVDLDSGQSRQITVGKADNAHPHASSDGRSVLFLRNHKELYRVPARGGEPKLIYAFKGHNQTVDFPSWTRDGRAIVISLVEKTGDIFVLRWRSGKQ